MLGANPKGISGPGRYTSTPGKHGERRTWYRLHDSIYNWFFLRKVDRLWESSNVDGRERWRGRTSVHGVEVSIRPDSVAHL